MKGALIGLAALEALAAINYGFRFNPQLARQQAYKEACVAIPVGPLPRDELGRIA